MSKFKITQSQLWKGVPLLNLRSRIKQLLVVAALIGWVSSSAWAQLPSDQNIVGLGFADLMSVEVTSAEKREQKLSDVAAAIYVLTGEEIRRSGVRTIPAALRLVPGLEVARYNNSTWAVSARGFNSTTANKLLVLIDGRSVYTPLFGGVFWDVENVPLEDVDRIEVIRGPGTTLWGSNAVNGVVNIIRKKAADTQGSLAVVGAGNQERDFGNVRYGGKAGDNVAYRLYANYSDRGEGRLVSGSEPNDDNHLGQEGFRADWTPDKSDLITTQGDLYQGREGDIRTIFNFSPPASPVQQVQTDMKGGNVLSRWTHEISESSNYQLQVYYDRTARTIERYFAEQRDIYDADFQNEIRIGKRNRFVWGGGVRTTEDDVANTFSVSWNPSNYTYNTYNSFVQDEIQVWPDFRVMVGSKVEKDSYTPAEFEPNARFSWLPDTHDTIWGAVSRAVRKPTRFDRDIRILGLLIPTSPPTEETIFGSKNFTSEDLWAYELGYRVHPDSPVTLDLATFYNVYDNLRSLEPGAPFASSDPAPHTVNPFFFENQLRGESYGAEISPEWQVSDWWKLQGQYTYLHIKLHLKPGSMDFVSLPAEHSDPSHQLSIRSLMNLPHSFEVDGDVRYVDNLPSLQIRSYTTGDLRIGWRGLKDWDFDVVGENLFQDHHQETNGGWEVVRGLYGKVSWHH